MAVDNDGYLIDDSGARHVPSDPQTALDWLARQVSQATGDPEATAALTRTATRVAALKNPDGTPAFTPTEQRQLLKMRHRATYPGRVGEQARAAEEELRAARNWPVPSDDTSRLIDNFEKLVKAPGKMQHADARGKRLNAMLEKMSGNPNLGPDAVGRMSEAALLATGAGRMGGDDQRDFTAHAVAALRAGRATTSARLSDPMHNPAVDALDNYTYALSKLALHQTGNRSDDAEKTRELVEKARTAQNYAANYIDPTYASAGQLDTMLGSALEGSMGEVDGTRDYARGNLVGLDDADRISDRLAGEIASRGFAAGGDARQEVGDRAVAELDTLDLGSSQRDEVEQAVRLAAQGDPEAGRLLDSADLGSSERETVDAAIREAYVDGTAAEASAFDRARDEVHRYGINGKPAGESGISDDVLGQMSREHAAASAEALAMIPDQSDPDYDGEAEDRWADELDAALSADRDSLPDNPDTGNPEADAIIRNRKAGLDLDDPDNQLDEGFASRTVNQTVAENPGDLDTGYQRPGGYLGQFEESTDDELEAFGVTEAYPDRAVYDPDTGQLTVYALDGEVIGGDMHVDSAAAAASLLADEGFDLSVDLSDENGDGTLSAQVTENPAVHEPGWGQVKATATHVFRESPLGPDAPWERRRKGDLVGRWEEVSEIPPSARNVAPGEAAAALGGRCILCGHTLKDAEKHGGYGSSCIRKVR